MTYTVHTNAIQPGPYTFRDEQLAWSYAQAASRLLGRSVEITRSPVPYTGRRMVLAPRR